LLTYKLQVSLAIRARLAAGNGSAPRRRNILAAFCTNLSRYGVAVQSVSGKGSVTLKFFNLCCGIYDVGHGQCSRNCRLIRLKVNASNKKGRFSDLVISAFMLTLS
jgi:hypothetical protein